MNSRAAMVLLVVVLVAFGAGLVRLFELRLEAGDGTDFVRALAPEARVFVNGDSAFGIDVGGFLNQSQFLVYYADKTALVANPLALWVDLKGLEDPGEENGGGKHYKR